MASPATSASCSLPPKPGASECLPTRRPPARARPCVARDVACRATTVRPSDLFRIQGFFRDQHEPTSQSQGERGIQHWRRTHGGRLLARAQGRSTSGSAERSWTFGGLLAVSYHSAGNAAWHGSLLQEPAVPPVRTAHSAWRAACCSQRHGRAAGPQLPWWPRWRFARKPTNFYARSS